MVAFFDFSFFDYLDAFMSFFRENVQEKQKNVCREHFNEKCQVGGEKFEITKFEITKFEITKFEITKFDITKFEIILLVQSSKYNLMFQSLYRVLILTSQKCSKFEK